jgi:hypothetical protein
MVSTFETSEHLTNTTTERCVVHMPHGNAADRFSGARRAIVSAGGNIETA